MRTSAKILLITAFFSSAMAMAKEKTPYCDVNYGNPAGVEMKEDLQFECGNVGGSYFCTVLHQWNGFTTVVNFGGVDSLYNATMSSPEGVSTDAVVTPTIDNLNLKSENGDYVSVNCWQYGN